MVSTTDFFAIDRRFEPHLGQIIIGFFSTFSIPNLNKTSKFIDWILHFNGNGNFSLVKSIFSDRNSSRIPFWSANFQSKKLKEGAGICAI